MDLDNIFSAIQHNEISFLRYFLDQDINVDILNSSGMYSPLQLAILNNSKQLMETLIDYGAGKN